MRHRLHQYIFSLYRNRPTIVADGRKAHSSVRRFVQLVPTSLPTFSHNPGRNVSRSAAKVFDNALHPLSHPPAMLRWCTLAVGKLRNSQDKLARAYELLGYENASEIPVFLTPSDELAYRQIVGLNAESGCAVSIGIANYDGATFPSFRQDSRFKSYAVDVEPMRPVK